MTKVKSLLLKEQWVLLLVVIAVISVVTGSVNPRFFSLNNIISILEQISTLGLIASGATILIISGNFDVSVGAVVGLSSCIMAILINLGVPVIFAVSAGVLFSIACSLFIGGCAILFRAPSFIISLVSIGIFKGISLAMTGGVIQTIYGKFETIGMYRIWGVIPLIFVISLVCYLMSNALLRYTKLGRRVYAIGNNERAAFLSGIKVTFNKLVFFGINGLLVGLAAMMLLSRVGAVQPSTGSGMELNAMGAVVIGGTPMSGGRGKIIGTFVGVLLMGVISNALNMLKVNPYFQDIVYGFIVIIALATSSFSVRFSSRRVQKG